MTDNLNSLGVKDDESSDVPYHSVLDIAGNNKYLNLIFLTLGCIQGILQQTFPSTDRFSELPLEDGILPETYGGLKQSPFLKSHVGPQMHT